MTQQQLELKYADQLSDIRQKYSKLNDKVIVIEQELAVHKKECEMNSKAINEKLNKVYDKEIETIKTIESAAELSNQRFAKIHTKLWQILCAVLITFVAISGWLIIDKFDRMNKYHNQENMSYFKVRIYKI